MLRPVKRLKTKSINAKILFRQVKCAIKLQFIPSGERAEPFQVNWDNLNQIIFNSG